MMNPVVTLIAGLVIGYVIGISSLGSDKSTMGEEGGYNEAWDTDDGWEGNWEEDEDLGDTSDFLPGETHQEAFDRMIGGGDED